MAELDDEWAIPAGAPWIVRGIFGEGHWCTRWVLSLCAEDPEFFQHITEQAAGYIHYLCLVRLALLNQQPENEMPIEELATWIRSTSRKTIMKQLYNPYPQGTLKILTKLGRRPLSKNDYRRLIRLLGREGCAQALRHMRHIKPYQLAWMDEFPTEYLHPKLLGSIKKGTDYQTLKYIFRTFDAFSNEQVHVNLFGSIRQIQNLEQLTRWFQRQLKKLDFPIPPWSGNSWIKPITSASDLHKYANDFHNCLDDYTRAILLGNRYFYVSQHGPAIISLVRDPLLGWLIEEINGQNNNKPRKIVVESILCAFTKAGFRNHPLGDDTYQYDMLWHTGHEE